MLKFSVMVICSCSHIFIKGFECVHILSEVAICCTDLLFAFYYTGISLLEELGYDRFSFVLSALTVSLPAN